MKEKSGLNFFEGITLIFITLKLCDIINWGWIWVLSPIWIPLLIYIILKIIIKIMK